MLHQVPLSEAITAAYLRCAGPDLAIPLRSRANLWVFEPAAMRSTRLPSQATSESERQVRDLLELLCLLCVPVWVTNQIS